MTSSNIVVSRPGASYKGLPGLFTQMRRDVFMPSKAKGATPTFTVGKLLSAINPAPKHALLLGQCKDGLPFLMQLIDPAIGAILIGGDTGCGKTHQLQVLVDSSTRLNPPHDLQVSILTHKPNEWRSFWGWPRQEKFLFQIKAWYDPSAEALIEGLVHLAEARREGLREGASILMILDDFGFVEELSYEAQVNLHWLLAYGAQSGIWIAAAINAIYAEKLRYWIDSFRTRIIGSIRSKSNADILSVAKDSIADGIEPGFFQVWTGADWRLYRLPLLGD
ncbi:MAG: hypothetical protein SVP52_03580 [Chloroflexota bacterium]|nr:hypothetical protein [Chloroflexota bacterium]